MLAIRVDFLGRHARVGRLKPGLVEHPELHIEEVGVSTPKRHEFVVCAHFDQASFVEHEDAIRVPNRRKPMGNHHHALPAGTFAQDLLENMALVLTARKLDLPGSGREGLRGGWKVIKSDPLSPPRGN